MKEEGTENQELFDTGGIPPAIADFVRHIFRVAVSLLREGKSLTSFAFIGSTTKRRMSQLRMDMSTDESKDVSAEAVRMIAEKEEADVIAIISESWTLPEEMNSKYEEIIEKYGSIGASPYRQEIVSLSVGAYSGESITPPKSLLRL